MNDPTNRSVSDWIADLEISEAQASAGNTIPLAPALKRLRDSIVRAESKSRGKQHREALPHR